MKEFVTIAVAFLVVVILALYMFMSNQKHSIAVIENKRLQEDMIKNDNELKNQIEELKNHVKFMDSIYHNNKKYEKVF